MRTYQFYFFVFVWLSLTYTLLGILMKMKDRKKPANKKYLTWGPSSEEEAVEPASPTKKEDSYLNSLKSIIEESKVETGNYRINS